ncbi:MAG: NnrS family protein [Pseudohongiellaceae bacterium]
MTTTGNTTPTLLSYGFRPLFLLMGAYALIGPVLWMLAWTGQWPAASVTMNPWWHGHDMLMGLAAAAIGGFLLTAVANWTATRPVQGSALVWLCLFWISGRLLPLNDWPALVADGAYWTLLWGLIALPILRTGNRRNYKVLALVAALAATDFAVHLSALFSMDWLRQAVWLQLWLVILLINLVGGRIIPAFTGNWLRKQSERPLSTEELPAAFSRLDLIGGVALAVFAAGVVTQQPAWWTVPAGALSGLLQLIRLYRWKTWKTLTDPLVWMLHLSWAWIPVGTLLWTLAELGMLPVSAAVHALGIGAVAGMILSVASRAALGHTGRALLSHPLLTGAILLLSLAALSRTLASIDGGAVWLWVSLLCWVLAFGGWLARFAPILAGRLEDG